MAQKQQAQSPQKPESGEASQPVEPPSKKRRKLVLLLVLLLLIVGAGGAGFYFMQPAHPDAGASAPKPPVFLPLETFTVNLVSDSPHVQLMQAAITLKLTEKATAELIKERLPEVRDRVLIVLSAKKSTEILPVAGKQKLAAEIADAVKKVIAPAPTAAAAVEPAAPAVAQPGSSAAKPFVEVLFTSFIVQ